MIKQLVVTALVLMVAVPIFSTRQVTAVDLPNVTVTPNHFELNLTAGTRINKSITLVWTGDYPIIVFFQTSITPDGDGMNLWFSTDPVSLLPSTSVKVNMSIKALVNIAPGHYKIDIYVVTDTNKLAELYNMTAQLKAQIAVLEGQIRNMSGTNITAMLATIQTLKDTIASMNNTIKNIKIPDPIKPDYTPFYIAIAILIIIVVVLSFLLLRKNRNTDGETRETPDRIVRPTYDGRIDAGGVRRQPVMEHRYTQDIGNEDVAERVRNKKKWVHGPFD